MKWGEEVVRCQLLSLRGRGGGGGYGWGVGGGGWGGGGVGVGGGLLPCAHALNRTEPMCAGVGSQSVDVSQPEY